MQRCFSAAIALLVCVITLTACGLKGPLYRPDEPAQTGQAVPAEPDKLRRPRPAPQVQKEPLPPPTQQPAPVSPVDPDAPNRSGVEPLPADETP